jgi:hypothetical protein
VDLTVQISDAHFRIGVLGGAVVLAGVISAVRFCGSVSLPEPPAPPTYRADTGNNVMDESNASPVVYQDFLAKDAALAGVAAPSYEAMSRKLLYRVDEGRQVLEVGAKPVDMAGLRLQVLRSDDAIVLEILNTTKANLGYIVVTEPTPNLAGCSSVGALPFNAMVIEKGQRETRVECAYRPNLAISVIRVETVELSPLQAWYVAQVPPRHVGIDDRIGRGHRQPKSPERCISLVSQAVRTGIENGEIVWRDLVDFYARHRCQTYAFPASYRAFTSDGQRRIPSS